MNLPPLPAGHAEPMSPAARRALGAGMLAAHVAVGWALLQLEPVRQAVGEVIPITVDFIAPPAPVPAPPPPPVPRVQIKPAPTPKPVITSAPTPAPQPPVFVAPPAPPAPAPPAPVEAAPAPPAPPAPPAAPPQPKTISISAVQYLTPPVLNYPPAARRAGESGRVNVRVLVDAQGLPQQMQIARSSGFPRLDEAALATVRATRFKPYMENGQPHAFWVLMPLIFELEE
ncbi:energy transducer TonB [Azohydromonas caseinilytica]|uniref:Energy transducer TonB n=1 Tax=Azohydromonas caseinilytica TaxID=2728836 RepID=A0A848FDG5_9BURK|nr:energy transducer TonB [Azohydromonas caseinilytica]NML16323.1 energy transducer TonB [Azohydromonas caseinilytica]